MPDHERSKRAALAALAPARRKAYAFLSDAFSQPPSDAALASLVGEAFLESAKDLFSSETLAALRASAETCANASELQTVIRQEFMNLFKVPGGQYVTPYESVFRDKRDVGGQRVKGLLMGPSAVDVQKWYRLAAVEISEEYKDLPDHICLELNYLAHLCGKEGEFAGAGDDGRLTRAWEMERDFLAAHVVSWASGLRDRIHEKSKHAYFRAIADMMVEFCQRDLATLESLLGESAGRSAPEYEKIES